MDVDTQKRAAAARALEFVRPGMRLGLGSGSTAKHFVELLAERVRAGLDVIAVPTSEATRADAERLGVPLTSLDETPELDLTVDGADEIGPDLSLIKGGGGALLREKIVARAARRLVIVIDEGKRVDRLGRRHPLPVLVAPFGWSTHAAAVRDLGGEAALRREAAGGPYVTDDGNWILDCRFPGAIADPAAVDRALRSRAGVVETGLFLGLSPEVIVGRRT